MKETKWKVKFKSKNYIEIFLSMHARTSEANILHLEQRAALKCLTHKLDLGQFWLFIARQ